MAAYRIGHGYDVHRLVPGRKLILGGVEISHEMGLDGHSDADVLTHAVMDAMLGALALGDIGTHFPPDDPKFKDADSLALLTEVARMIHEENYRLVNMDATIVAEKPRISGHVPQMRQKLAVTLGCKQEAVSVKATTEEGLGFTGAGMGISAHCVVLLEKIGHAK